MNYKNNIFYIEKIKAANLIKKFGSPIYCYSNRRLVDNINNFKNSFKKFNPLFCFSVKSNYNTTILKIIKFPIPKQDDIWIDFRHQIPRINHVDLDWSSVKGKIVFIGATFQGSTFVLTPNGLKNPHDIMAMSTETLLSGKYIQRPDWLPKLEWIGFILGA